MLNTVVAIGGYERMSSSPTVAWVFLDKSYEADFKTCIVFRHPLTSNRATVEGRLWIGKSALYARTCLSSKFQGTSKHITLTSKSKCKRNEINKFKQKCFNICRRP